MIHTHPFVEKLNRFILGKADQSGSIAELNVSGFDFPTQLDTLFSDIIAKKLLPPLVILTGNAGDGKSHLIFKIWLYLTQQKPFLPPSDSTLPSLHQLQGNELEEALQIFQRSFSGERADAVVAVKNYLLVKDASAVNPADLKELFVQSFIRLIETPPTHGEQIAIISINEGILRTQLRDIAEQYSQFTANIEEILQNLEESKNFFSPDEIQVKRKNSEVPEPPKKRSALVLNLNTRDLSSLLLENILNELAQTQLFIGPHSLCVTCPVFERCPIRFNILTLGDSKHLARQRIVQLFETLNYMGQHITLREALSVLSYALTGNLTCVQIQQAFNTREEVEQLTLPGIVEQDPPLSQAEERFLLRLLPYIFSNILFAQSIRQEEIDKLSQLLPIAPLGNSLSEERVLFNLGLLDPAGFAVPSHDVETSFVTTALSPLQHTPSPGIASPGGGKEAILGLDTAIFEVLRALGQRMSTKGIPDARWLRSLVITSKRHAFFFTPHDGIVMRRSIFFYYEDFKRIVNILKKKQPTFEERSTLQATRRIIVEALNQFQQPHTVGSGIGDLLEMIQRDHLVLFKRIPTTEFELVPATPLPSVYVEQAEMRIRILHKRSHTTLDCDLLLYEFMRRFVSGSLSLEGLESRVTDIENFLARLRGTAQDTERSVYTVVGNAIAFSVEDGQIIVRRV